MVSDEVLGEISKKLFLQKSGLVMMPFGQERIALTIDLLQSLAKETDIVVWIAPAACLSKKNYVRNIKRSRKYVTGRFYFFSVEGISISDFNYLKLYNLIDKYRAVAVLDEGISIKNTKAGRTSRLLFIAKKFKYRLVLSSIPLTRGLIDLYAQLQFLNSAILKMTKTQFFNMFMPYYTDMYPIRRRWSTPLEEHHLIEMLKPYVIWSCLNEPPLICRRDYLCQLNSLEKKFYLQEKEAFLKEKEKVSFLEIVQKFQHIYTLAQSKVKVFAGIVAEIRARSEKVVVLVKFFDEIKMLEECGILQGVCFSVLGSFSKKKNILREFQEKSDILFCSYGIGGFHLNLEFCNNIVYYSQTFDYKNKLQSLYNVYNVRQKKVVNVYNLWVDTGLENLMRDNLSRKEMVLENMYKNIDCLKVVDL